ncbi:NAD(P)-binding protein [Acaromyces ingoldii]|uniref:NAD(P)-binding protein n=1 Tax=Acaromyces ingoldii TaxID=215250 RepID=A0A316YBT3_9BASI|nr:NAD(P)-binding protein [Acaromyces ingoldii]PWN86719.1 NAD(P)-binding protein [Acaromyces ingoldii]
MYILCRGTTVLVTNATGLVGSSVAAELLVAGFKVLKQHLELEFGSATVEIVEVADPSAPGALDHAVQGVSGIIHVAMDASMSTDPDAVINSVGSCSTSLSEAAARSKDVKSVVLTSSSVAVFGKTGKQPIVVDKQANQDDIVPYAYSAKDDDLSKAAAVYMASKVKGEQAAWALVKGKGFAFNNALPYWFLTPPGFFCNDVRDVARAHVAALVADEIKDQRIFAMTELWSIEELAGAIQKGQAAPAIA